MFKQDKWTVRNYDGFEYTCIGYETRGLWEVPVADCIDGQYIQSDVYEIIHDMHKRTDGLYVSIMRPNAVELRLLAEAGWTYDGCFATKRGE